MEQEYSTNEHWERLSIKSNSSALTPELLLNKAMEYFLYCDMNPILTKRVLTSGKEAGKMMKVETTRPYSITGMCIHCDINQRYIDDIKNSGVKDSDFYAVIEKILMVIYTQNLEYAIADIFNPIMVSKTLKLDKDNNDEGNTVVRVEVVHVNAIKGEDKLPNTEFEVLEKLNQEKLDLVNAKAENLER